MTWQSREQKWAFLKFGQSQILPPQPNKRRQINSLAPFCCPVYTRPARPWKHCGSRQKRKPAWHHRYIALFNMTGLQPGGRLLEAHLDEQR
jgi:hypothetical protein